MKQRGYRILTIVLVISLLQVVPVKALNLEEANVVGVVYNNTGTQFTFDVTLLHDDDAESPNYADLWIVEDLEENELIRRELLHGHGTVEFTRSASGEISELITKLVVRASDQLHGWGGQLALVDLESETVKYVDQGDERRVITLADFTDTSITSIESEVSGKDQTPFPIIFLPVLFGIVMIRRRLYKFT